MIEIRGISKRFGERAALADVSLAVSPGELLVVLGPEGAGKTTLVRLLLGLLRPTVGTLQVAGLDPATDPDAVRARAGAVGNPPGLYPRLSAGQNLAFFARLHGLGEPRVQERTGELLRAFELGDRPDAPVGTLAVAPRQRLALARALLHDPQVLLLDEPTAALDPQAASEIHDRLRALRDAGKTLLVCTRDVALAERLATRVAMLSTRLVACDTPLGLRRASGARRLALRMSRVTTAEMEIVQALPFVRGFELSQGWIRVRVNDPDRDVPSLVRKLVEAGAEVHEVRDDDPPLEEVYLKRVEAP